jgi:hypothetical protein
MAEGRETLYVAQRTFWVGNTLVKAGDTVVVGHPLLVGRERLFRPLAPTFGLPAGRPAATGAERAVAAPGEIRAGPPAPTNQVDALVFDHTRRELEELAAAAGVADAGELPNKTAIAEAIVGAEGA